MTAAAGKADVMVLLELLTHLSANANLLDKDAATITAEMEGMTEAQIEAMLESASDFL